MTGTDRIFIKMSPPVSSEAMVDNMRSALARGLREVPQCKPHGEALAIAGGGPSLKTTFDDLRSQGHIAAVNGSLSYLLAEGVVPEFCGVCDPSPHMADIVKADQRVRYLVASNCDPSLFDKLLGAGCRVWVWHTTPASIGTNAGADMLIAQQPDTWQMVAGGCTMGLRWINLGYVLGYRVFHIHGLDSSFAGDKTHAYPDRRDEAFAEGGALEIGGYKTSLNFLQQVQDCGEMLERFALPDMERCEFEFYGDGLLQSCWRKFRDGSASRPREAFLGC